MDILSFKILYFFSLDKTQDVFLSSLNLTDFQDNLGQITMPFQIPNYVGVDDSLFQE